MVFYRIFVDFARNPEGFCPPSLGKHKAAVRIPELHMDLCKK
jgi:hypothetical protein